MNPIQRNQPNILTITEKYIIKHEIGSGPFAEVRLIEDIITKQTYALKLIPNKITYNNNSKNLYNRELNTFNHLTCSENYSTNLIKLLDNGRYLFDKNSSPSDLHIGESDCLILEYAENGSLFDYIKCENGGGFPEPIARYLFLQVINGLEALHNANLAHGDLKTENILLQSDWKVKICDFGNAYGINYSLLTQASNIL